MVAVIISVAVFNEPLTGRLVTVSLLIIGAVTLTILSEHVAEAMKNIPFIRRMSRQPPGNVPAGHANAFGK